MSLLDLLAPDIPTPRMSTPTLEIRNKYYAVTDGTVFSYYPITYEDASSNPNIIRLVKSPPLLLEGWVIVEKKIYLVTTEDLLRKIIRKSRLVTLESINGSITATTNRGPVSSDAVSTVVSTALQHINQSGALSVTEVEVSQAADAAWSEQVRSLLDLENEEEGLFSEAWEIEDTA